MTITKRIPRGSYLAKENISAVLSIKLLLILSCQVRIYQDFALTSRIVVRKVFNVDYVFNFTNHGYFAAKQHFARIASTTWWGGHFLSFLHEKRIEFPETLMSSTSQSSGTQKMAAVRVKPGIDGFHSRDMQPYWLPEAKGIICIKIEFKDCFAAMTSLRVVLKIECCTKVSLIGWGQWYFSPILIIVT